MAASPSASIPQQAASFAEMMATYRFFSNPRVEASAILAPHFKLTQTLCQQFPVVLAIADDTVINKTAQEKVTGLAPAGNQHGKGFLQHTTLAVTPQGQVLGMLDCVQFLKTDRPKGETATQRDQRWNMSDAWPDAIARVGTPAAGCMYVHVADRGADCYETFLQSELVGVHYLVRLCKDRPTQDDTTLMAQAAGGRCAGHKSVTVAATSPAKHTGQRTGKHTGKGGAQSRKNVRAKERVAHLEVKYAPLTVSAPQRRDYPAINSWVLRVEEIDPPADVQPLRWTLLTNVPITSDAMALEVAGWYEKRWIIEEFHKALKTVCRAEKSQLDEYEDHKRLISIMSVLAVWLLQLRDLARVDHEDADDPRVLRGAVAKTWIKVVAQIAKVPVWKLTLRTFMKTLARQGGHIGRKSDGPPGFQTLYRGWIKLAPIVDFLDDMENT